MKIEFDSPEEYDALCGMLISTVRYWKKRRQEAEGRIVMTLDDRGSLCASHYTKEEIARELSHAEKMWDIVKNMPHQEYRWNDEEGDWIPADFDGEFATWVEDEEVEEIEEAIEEDAEVPQVEGRLHLNPRPDLSADMIEWMNRPAYAEGRWNLGYKDNVKFKERG